MTRCIIFLLSALFSAAIPAFLPVQVWAISIGQLDAFSAPGNSLGWVEGGPSPNPPTQNIGLGGNGLAGHLEIASDGSGPGGKQLFWNVSQWTGDYVTAGVEQISLFADNRSGNGQQIDLRLGFYGGNAGDLDWFVSDAVILLDASGWTPITFDISPDDLTFAAGFGGAGDAATTLANVVRVEILSESGAPFSTGSSPTVLQGDAIVSNLRIDEITALSAAPGIPGDYDGSGTVDVNDYNAWKAAFANAVSQPGDGADGNANGVVDAADYTVWLDALGATGTAVGTANTVPVNTVPSNTVPEPSTLILTLLLIAAVGTRRRGIEA